MRRVGVPAAVALGLIGASTASAADWQFDPFVEVGALVNDNYTLALNDPEIVEVTGGFADAALQVRAVSPRANWVFEPRVRSLLFPDEQQFETTDFFFNVLGEQRGERNAFGVVADFSDQDIVQSQLPGADFGDVDLGQEAGPDSGLIVGDNRQQLLRARPYAEFQLSEITRLRFEGRAEDVSFDRQVVDTFVSYQTLGGAVQLSRQFTPASRVGLRLDYQQVEPDAAIGKSEIATATVQWDYQVAERLSAYARAGATQSTIERAGATPLAPRRDVEETTPLLAAGVRWNFLKSELLVDYQRSVDANSSGFVVDRDDLRVYYNHRFTVKLRGFAAAYAVRDESVTSTGGYAPRRYFTASTGLEWRFRKSLSLLGQIDTSRQKFDGGSGTADGTAARVSLYYRPYRRD